MSDPKVSRKLEMAVSMAPKEHADEMAIYLGYACANTERVEDAISLAMEALDVSLNPTDNVFCPTGAGGGVDPSCSPGGAKASKGATSADPKTPPPPGPAYTPNVEKKGASGTTIAARVGVPGDVVPPPPAVPKLPNLTPRERRIEASFIAAFEKDPDKMADDFTKVVKATTKPGDPPTFGTDDAKVLSDAWGVEGQDPNRRAENRATLNLALHQTANAIAKRAFVKHLDTLKPGDEVLVTVGGVGAGKGYALKNVPEALAMKQRSKAVWDSAGDQNATENPWIQKELERRGLKGNYVFVHADPYAQWADPKKGVVKRAGDPSDGRMVDAKVFADSYGVGVKNHQTFYERNLTNKNASFMFIDNTGTPKRVPGIPKSATKIDRKALAAYAEAKVLDSDAPKHVKRGATIGKRVWGDE